MEKKTRSYLKRTFSSIFKKIFVILISVTSGYFIAQYGNNDSFVESGAISTAFTLFGFGITSTVFIYQAFSGNKSENVKALMIGLAKTLKLTFFLLLITIIMDFLASLEFNCKVINAILIAKYSSLVFTVICLFDILNAFLIIITGKNDN